MLINCRQVNISDRKKSFVDIFMGILLKRDFKDENKWLGDRKLVLGETSWWNIKYNQQRKIHWKFKNKFEIKFYSLECDWKQMITGHKIKNAS